ncbi:accessory Sec system glycosylation protein GtfA [Pilibacter termitis]|uniref:Accessory Sec system glycosylation protein GtfA n=1 Tax=Pilibacter termitis TaxID=263852 RepID=A0A1T4NSE9_9ENTE|nr:glycosyltransferase [Pilibacter termitis]SJZ82183.1 accessory Sec system glycosylation protein GtfA [Pilibacter termitis]
MNFFINKAMGLGNSGVEHAQFYRAKCFRREKLPYKYVFMELVKNLHEAMEKWKIGEQEVINIWEFFVLGDAYLFEGVKERYAYKETLIVDSTNTHRVKETYTSSGLFIREHFEKSPNPKDEKTLLVSNYKTEIFDARTHEKKIVFQFLHHARRNRTIGNIHLYNFQGQHLFFRNEILFQRFFLHYLAEKFEGRKNFFIDRGEETEVALFNHRPKNTKIIELIHADHLSDREVVSAPLWNNYYEYLLTHSQAVDRIVVATKLQREDLLLDFPNGREKIVAIPVGGIDDIDFSNRAKEERRIRKFVTASRLAAEKHLDLIIQAVVQIYQEFPFISLDIFGQGGEDVKLRALIQELKAEDYIRLKGHSDKIEEEFKRYDAFISASFSEGFGLTYIEALNMNLPILTFNARFGALELVKHNENGIIKEFSRENDTFNIEQLKSGIYDLFFAEFMKDTRFSVAEYQESVIAKQWKELVNGL